MMLMSIANIAATTGHNGITKDDAGEVTSRVHKKGRSKIGRRQIKRSERQKLRNELSKDAE